MATTNSTTEEDLSCPVCLNTFDYTDHEPKRLTCPHSVCVTCVRWLASPTCPVCRLDITHPISELARDLSTLRLLASHTCSECDKLGELQTCKLCKIRLCELCEKRHKTSEHCKISSDIKAINKKLNTKALKHFMSKKAVPLDESQTMIEQIFENFQKECEVTKRHLCDTARASNILDDATRKVVREAAEVKSLASLILEETRPRKLQVETMVGKTAGILRDMADMSFDRPDDLLENLEIYMENFTSGIKKLGEMMKISSDPLNPSFGAVAMPNYGGKKRVIRVIDEASPGNKLREIWSLAECPRSRRVFVGVIMKSNYPNECESQIQVYENWKWVKSITVNLAPWLLFVHEGRLYVVGERTMYGRKYFITAYDSQTGDYIYEHALATHSQHQPTTFFPNRYGGHISYNLSHDDQTIQEWSLTGQVMRRITLKDSPVHFGQWAYLAVSSRYEFSLTEDGSEVYMFSSTGEYKSKIELPGRHSIVLLTTDYQDNLLILVKVDDSRKNVVFVYDKDQKHVATIDLSERFGIDSGSDLMVTCIASARDMIVTKAGDLVVAAADNQRSKTNKLYVF